MSGPALERFRGEGAVVTGASRGIGLAISRTLAGVGFRLLLAARDEPLLARRVAELRAGGARVSGVPLDLAEPSSAAALVEAAQREFGAPPYALVNNAGIAIARRFDRLSPAEIERMVSVNLAAPIRLSRAFLPGMLSRSKGHLLHLSSGAADFPPPRLAVYAASKAGLRSFSVALDLEMRRRGVRSSVLEPIFVRTELGIARGDIEPPLERLHREHPRFVIEPERVARAVLRTLARPRPRVPVPSSWAWVRGVGSLARPLLRRWLELPAPAGLTEPDTWSPMGPPGPG